MADVQPGVIAAIDGDDVGITTIVHHSPYAAEVHLMAVVPLLHRRGVGRAMLERVPKPSSRAMASSSCR